MVTCTFCEVGRGLNAELLLARKRREHNCVVWCSLALRRTRCQWQVSCLLRRSNVWCWRVSQCHRRMLQKQYLVLALHLPERMPRLVEQLVPLISLIKEFVKHLIWSFKVHTIVQRWMLLLFQYTHGWVEYIILTRNVVGWRINDVQRILSGIVRGHRLRRKLLRVNGGRAADLLRYLIRGLDGLLVAQTLNLLWLSSSGKPVWDRTKITKLKLPIHFYIMISTVKEGRLSGKEVVILLIERCLVLTTLYALNLLIEISWTIYVDLLASPIGGGLLLESVDIVQFILKFREVSRFCIGVLDLFHRFV